MESVLQSSGRINENTVDFKFASISTKEVGKCDQVIKIFQTFMMFFNVLRLSLD